jgi:hypothetical protein
VLITESGARNAKSLKLSDSLSSGSVVTPTQPSYWRSGSVSPGWKLYQSAQGESGLIVVPSKAPMPGCLA